MSLPTYAVFYNKENVEIARQFVNVGWWVDADNFSDAVAGLAIVHDTDYIELYGIKVPYRIIKELHERVVTYDSWKGNFSQYLKPKLKDFEAKNNDMKLAIREFYIKNQEEIKREN